MDVKIVNFTYATEYRLQELSLCWQNASILEHWDNFIYKKSFEAIQGLHSQGTVFVFSPTPTPQLWKLWTSQKIVILE